MIKAYKKYFNEDKGAIDLIEYEVKRENDFSREPATNLADAAYSHFVSKSLADESVKKLNEELIVGKSKLGVCSRCSRYYLLIKGGTEKANEGVCNICRISEVSVKST